MKAVIALGIAVLIVLIKSLTGFLIVHLLWDSRKTGDMLLKLCLGLGAGMGISSLLYFLWYWFGLPPQRYFVFELIALVLLIVLNWVHEPVFPMQLQLRRVSLSGQTLAWLVLAAVAVLSCSVKFALNASQNPYGVDDAWNIWNVAARFIYRTGDNSWFLFLSKDTWFHTDYPLLLGLNIDDGWSIMGTESVFMSIVIPFAFMIGMIGLIFASLKIIRGVEQAALAVIVISSVTWLPYFSAWEYGDLPLSYYFLGCGALLYLCTIMPGKSAHLAVCAGLFAGLAAWTKNEGIVFILVSTTACCLLSWQSRKNLLKYFVLGLVLPIVVIFLFKTLTVGNDLFANRAKSMFQLLDPSRYTITLSSMVFYIFGFGGWPVSFAGVMLIYAILVWKRSRVTGRLWVVVFLLSMQYLAYFGIYLITPNDLAVHIGTSLSRLVFQLLPLGILAIFIFLPSPPELQIIPSEAVFGAENYPEEG